MADGTEKQTELAITTAEETKEEDTKSDDKTQTDLNDVKCKCGVTMVKATEDQYCNGCEFYLEKTNGEEYYHCPKGKEPPHTKGYDLCLNCAKHIQNFNTNPIKDIHDREKLYFVYTDEIKGPMTIDDITTLYITKKIKATKMYVMAATGGNEWSKLEFPQNVYNKFQETDKKRCDTMPECEKRNSEIKQKFPDLYANLIENVLSDKLNRIVEPDEIPKDEQTLSLSFKWFIRLLGKILVICMFIIIILHCLPLFIILCVISCVVGCIALCISFCVEYDFPDDIAVIMLLLLYSSMFIIPIVIVHFLLTEVDTWDELQSWMISYIVWGAFSFLISAIIIVSVLPIVNKDTGKKIIDATNNIILLIIGVKFNTNDDLFDVAAKDASGFCILFVFPSLASLLPAAVCGFIANFILEEKFELKCNVNIISDLCFASDYGCCDVISSHDYRNSYAFIGGLASNIIATWAVIRVCGYLITNAFPDLSLYAERKK
eukprot:549848_1